jgi:hypothetical protein
MISAWFVPLFERVITVVCAAAPVPAAANKPQIKAKFRAMATSTNQHEVSVGRSRTLQPAKRI